MLQMLQQALFVRLVAAPVILQEIVKIQDLVFNLMEPEWMMKCLLFLNFNFFSILLLWLN